jgi:2-methylcitrate dehydratase PrpD
MSEPSTLIEQIAQHLQRPVDAATRERARLHLLDWLGCVAGARQGSVAQIAKAAEPDVITRAALIGNVLEMDDIERAAILHPGPVIWPSALSAIRDVGGSMDMLLDGTVRGYEAMIMIGATFDAHHYAHFHNTSTAGGFGAAAAAVSIFGNDEQAMVWALGNAGSFAGGLWHMRHDDVMTKQLHVTHAALSGLWVARLAVKGFTGPKALLEGPQGFYSAFTQQPKPLTLGTDWAMARVSFKPWAACRHAHPAIDCALELRAAGRLTPPFLVETYRDAILFCDRPNPVTEAEAKFSLQHAVAVIADGRNAEPQDFSLEAIAALAPLRAQVKLVEAPEISARYPAHYGARLNGLELIDTRGDPERPVSRSDIIAKVRTLIAWGGLPPAEADRAIALALALQSSDPAAIIAMLEDWL